MCIANKKKKLSLNQRGTEHQKVGGGKELMREGEAETTERGGTYRGAVGTRQGKMRIT